MATHFNIPIGRALAAILLALLALTLAWGQTALASPAHSAHAKKKKKPSQVLVHCASVTITCKPDAHNAGPTGPTGPAGAPGAPGTPGVAGHGIADRIRWSGAVTSADGTPVAVPLASPSFAQEAGEDERVLGLATVTAPTGECESGKPNTGEFEGIVTLDGSDFGVITEGSSTYSLGSKLTLPILWTDNVLGGELATEVGPLPIISAAVTNTFAITLSDNCNAIGTTHYVLDSVAIDVLRSN